MKAPANLCASYMLLYWSWGSPATGKGLHKDWVWKGHELERNSTM